MTAQQEIIFDLQLQVLFSVIIYTIFLNNLNLSFIVFL